MLRYANACLDEIAPVPTSPTRIQFLTQLCLYRSIHWCTCCHSNHYTFFVCRSRRGLHGKEHWSNCDYDPGKYDDSHRLTQTHQNGERPDHGRPRQEATVANCSHSGDCRTSSHSGIATRHTPDHRNDVCDSNARKHEAHDGRPPGM